MAHKKEWKGKLEKKWGNKMITGRWEEQEDCWLRRGWPKWGGKKLKLGNQEIFL